MAPAISGHNVAREVFEDWPSLPSRRGGSVAASSRIILSFHCDDEPGIVAAVTSLFAENEFSIIESSQFRAPKNDRFFMRTEYQSLSATGFDLNETRNLFHAVANRYKMTWTLTPSDYRTRVLIAVSKWGHCLNRLMNSWKYREVPIEIVGVISNHEELRSMTEWYGVDYHYLPVSKENRAEQEAKIMEIFESANADVLALARYMQILSDSMCSRLSGRAINIHHSFLPGFKGARPYHQAYDKGVKLIGATAHYVTADLDEGPIIEQSVVRATHADSPRELIEMGRDVEATVLANAVKWHAEKRVMLNGSKTVVLGR